MLQNGNAAQKTEGRPDSFQQSPALSDTVAGSPGQTRNFPQRSFIPKKPFFGASRACRRDFVFPGKNDTEHPLPAYEPHRTGIGEIPKNARLSRRPSV